MRRHRNAEHHRRTDGDAEGKRQHCQREELTRAGLCDMIQHVGNDTSPDQNRERYEDRDFEGGDRQRNDQIRVAAALAKQRRQQHQGQYREQILDDKPADRDMTNGSVEITMIDEDPDQHDRARHRQSHAEDEAG